MGLERKPLMYVLKTKTPLFGYEEIESKNVKILQHILTTHLRIGGNGFIWRKENDNRKI